MRIVQLTEDFSSGNAGVTSALFGLSRYLSEQGVSVRVVSAGDDSVPVPLGVDFDCHRIVRWGAAWRFSHTLHQAIARVISESDVLHVHGVWMYPQWAAMRLALRNTTPLVLTPHNMLGGWLWRRGLFRRMKKRIYWEAMVKSLVRRATVIHALSPNEGDVLRREFFPDDRIEVIPNGISVKELDDLSSHHEVGGQPEPRYMLFLGRIHPVKGLERLLDAFAYCGTAERLVVAGPCHSNGYMNQLLDRVRRLGIGACVRFAGQVAGADKWRLLRDAWVVCSPSFSEGMSMVTLEAMAVRTPVISSVQAAIPGWKDAGGLVFENDPHDFGRALKEVFSWSDSERLDRGAAARALVQRNYDWSVVGPQYLDLYHGLLA